MTRRRTVLAAVGLAMLPLAGCSGGGDDSAEGSPTFGSNPATATGAQEATATPAAANEAPTDEPLPDITDSAFLSAADEALGDAATDPGTGALYLEIINDMGTTYYATDTHTNLVEAAINMNGMLVFKTGGMNPHTFGVHDPFTTGQRQCVDDQEDESTSGYDVFGFSQHGAPNSLKPFDNELCSFEVTESDGVYTGLGTARAHFYTYNDGHHWRDMRFKYVFRDG